MAGHRTRRRRGHPRGKAWGFNGLRPASSHSSTKSSTQGQDDGSGTSSTPTSSTPSNQS